MKNTVLVLLTLVFIAIGGTSCTSDFDEINVNPSGFLPEEVSARYFITNPQVNLFAPNRFPYWRAHLIHTDRYAGHFTFGHHGSWWADALAYDYHSGYTDATWDWLNGAFVNINTFLNFTTVGERFENQYMYAAGIILKSLYFQIFTDVFGMIPYSEADNADILTPKFDTQKEIYVGIIADLDQAIATIGSVGKTGNGVNDLGNNDVYCGGDLQKWKRLANTLKLRIAMRALGANGDDFAEAAAREALAGDLLDESTGSILMPKDTTISQWASAAYGDVWHNFGGLGSKWTMGKTLIDYLKDNNDPRLSAYAKPAIGGTVEMVQPEGGDVAEFDKRTNFLIGVLNDAGASPVVTTSTNSGGQKVVTVMMAENAHYVGQPTRLNADIKAFAHYNLFSTPSDMVLAAKNSGTPFYPEIVISSAEAYFLRAEAAVRGFSSEDAQAMFQQGIREAMKIWNLASGDVDTYISNATLADISAGSNEEKLKKIAIQRWIASYTDGFEAWAIIRDTGYPTELSMGVSDFDIFASGSSLAGAYPQRLRYGQGVQTSNPDNYNAAVAAQGEDTQMTKLWFAKQ